MGELHNYPDYIDFRAAFTKSAQDPGCCDALCNKEHRNVLEFPFACLTLAICTENDRNGGYDPLNGREKVPVLTDRGNSQSYGSPLC